MGSAYIDACGSSGGSNKPIVAKTTKDGDRKQGIANLSKPLLFHGNKVVMSEDNKDCHVKKISDSFLEFDSKRKVAPGELDKEIKA